MKDKTSLSTQEVAEILNISKNTVYQLIKRRELPSYRVGRKVRIDLQDVEYYKNKSRTVSESVSQGILQRQRVDTLPLKAEMRYFDSQSKDNKAFIICGQDVILDTLTRYLERHPNGCKSLRYYTGSYNGLIELYRGNATVASCHLWNGDTGEYNISYVRSLLPGTPCVIIHLACRMQGFYVAKGNPKNITNWEDLARSDVLMVNREKGCGVRVLIDEHLRKLNISHKTVNGYTVEDFSHLAVASTVARGDVDVAVGNEKTALQVQGVDFIPIQKEKYDLVIKKEDVNKPEFQAIIDIINSKEFHKELLGIGGYDISETGKIVGET
ncbi:helix-turn-helix transcriptional regulator [Clostridiaceae bacterium UIB06]|uniref:Helix-turn-helix transcriptional regulator n=1 Tax=Clostridium thailandense TaxID=2794346 RepID=A0A949TUJ4_9CLOT|nr:helix-turn-helix transcriptional regulator [Clostridium thailandense]MBV7273731.1 helix-turn-helix transcriptional regulator [Clostridium thailandense]MCH5137489.1 helix-turn-helix transcriptional regulator [Clostridiaceae bacterium UIB06]